MAMASQPFAVGGGDRAAQGELRWERFCGEQGSRIVESPDATRRARLPRTETFLGQERGIAECMQL